jgi:hypothetical protein
MDGTNLDVSSFNQAVMDVPLKHAPDYSVLPVLLTQFPSPLTSSKLLTNAAEDVGVNKFLSV